MRPASSKDISSIYRKACTDGHACAIFRLPSSAKADYIVGSVSHRLGDGESAFVFAPFAPGRKPYYIKSVATSVPIGIVRAPHNKKHRSTSKKVYIGLVKKIIAKIKEGRYKKIVAARILAVDKPLSFDPVRLFRTLCDQYPAAFVSLTHIPGIGLWIGASPEVLVSAGKAKLTTFSLAGTKPIDDPTEWTVKEIEEQQIVTDFIRKKMEKLVGTSITVKGPLTHQAGSVKHLLSIITAEKEGTSLWHKVAKALHPTPAVSGMPQHKAIKFVQENESFDRAFYAGYLGPVDRDGKTNLFVNLRCMQVTEKQLLFYAGCGVTADSNPEKEWQESDRKIDILKRFI